MRVICTKTWPRDLPGCNQCAYETPVNDCAYYTRISEPIEVEDVPEKWQTLYGASQDALRDTIHECGDAWEAFDSAIAAFEELAGEHQTLRIRYAMHQDAPQPEQPGPGWYWVKGHWRSRTAPEARSEAAPTEDTAEAVSESLAQPQGQPGASECQRFERFFNPNANDCQDCATRACLTAQPECETVPIGDDVPTVSHAEPVSPNGESAAVCRWEVGRWGI